jgi:hypothetical protein
VEEHYMTLKELMDAIAGVYANNPDAVVRVRPKYFTNENTTLHDKDIVDVKSIRPNEIVIITK